MGLFLKSLLVAGIATIVMLSLFHSFNFVHESVHEQIFRTDGCENITVYYSAFEGYAQCEDKGFRSSPQANSEHMQNEIIGYNLVFVMMLVITVGVCLVVLNDYLARMREPQ